MLTVAAVQAGGNCRALIIFAKQPLPGAVKTRLVPPLSPEDAAELYACMLQDTLALAQQLVGITPFIFYQDSPGAADYFATVAPGVAATRQEGEDLGERMQRAFTEIFSRGFSEVAIIGSDAPDLPAEYVYEAFTQLEYEHTDVVIGPAADGGYYLLALKRVWAELFTAIPWSSADVLAATLARAGDAQLGVARLPLWYDLDTPEELKRAALRGEQSPAVMTGAFLRDRFPS